MEYNITYRRKDKGWQYIINVKKDGKWKYAGSKQGFSTKALAKVAAETRVDDLKDKQETEIKTNPEYKGITFGEFSEIHLEHKSIYCGRGHINNIKLVLKYFKAINDIPVIDVDTLNIQQCVDGMVGKIEPATIKTYVTIIRSVFSSAIKPYKIIKENPVQDIVMPKDKKVERERALSNSELNKLLGGITNQRYYIASLIAAKCGLRIGEILGLTWDRIDFKNRTITVDRQWKLLQDGSYGFGDVKSKNSNRVVPMPPIVVSELKKYKEMHPIDITGRLLPYKSKASFSQTLSNYYTKLGFKDTSAHCLRHTYGTMLIANGLDFKTVAELMGHDVKETMRTYSHVTSDMRKRATKIINQIF